MWDGGLMPRTAQVEQPGAHRRLARLVRSSRASSNAGWLGSERLVQFLVATPVSIALARYLGPSGLGRYAFALTIVSLLLPLLQLGTGFVVKDLVTHPEQSDVTLGSAFVLNLGPALAVESVLAGLCAWRMTVGDWELPLVILLVSVPLVLRPVQVLEYWYQARLEARLASRARMIGMAGTAVVQIFLIASHAGLVAVAAATLVAPLVQSVLYVRYYQRAGGYFRRWRVSRPVMTRLARDSMPLVIAAVSVGLYMDIDQLMLAWLSDSRQLGLYASAVRISEFTYFIPLALVTSATPALLRLRAESKVDYLAQLQVLLCYLTMIAMALTAVVVVGAPLLVKVAFGPEFAAAAPILAVHVATAVFVYLGVAESIWNVGESQQVLAMAKTIGGAVLNIVLNLLLIPPFGGRGAAWASLIAYAAATLLGNALHPRCRPLFRLEIRSLMPAVLVRTVVGDLSQRLRAT